MHILYKPGPDLYKVDWLSCHSHTESKDQVIASLSISMHTLSMAIDIPVCTSVEEMRNAMSIDAEPQMLQTYILRDWPQNKDNLEPMLSRYWSIRHELALIDSLAMNGK